MSNAYYKVTCKIYLKCKIDQWISMWDNKNFIDILDSVLQLTIKKLPLIDFWYNIKEYTQLS